MRMNCNKKLTLSVGDVDGASVGLSEGDFEGDTVGELVVGLALGAAVTGLFDGAAVMGESVLGDPVSSAGQANNAESPTSTSGSGSNKSGIPLLFPLSAAAASETISGTLGASSATEASATVASNTSEEPLPLLRVDIPTDSPIIKRNDTVAAMNQPILLFDDGY